MFLKAGALSLALLLASRLLGVVRESAQAAAFGTSGVADVAVLLVTLPDWIASVAASGALAYVLVPAWAGRTHGEVQALQRRVVLFGGALALALAALLAVARTPVAHALAGGLSPGLQGLAAGGIAWSALALPLALLSALWVTRLQHERDFVGMYGANLVVNVLLILAILVAGTRPREIVPLLGLGLLAAMLARLGWLRLRLPADVPPVHAGALPAPPVWLWAMLSAGLPLALPFTARSLASQGGEGALATFNYAWKLVELPLILAIQLVASLAFPRIAGALAAPDPAAAAAPIRAAFVLAWTLACAAAAGLLLGAPALAQLLFGWGRMRAGALPDVAAWGMAGAWGLLPQALSAVALTVLAARRRMHPAVAGYAAGLLLLLGAGLAAAPGGRVLMHLLNAAYLVAAVVCCWAMGPGRSAWLPWRAFVPPAAVLVAVGVAGPWLRASLAQSGVAAGLAAALLAAVATIGVSLWRSSDLRRALRR